MQRYLVRILLMSFIWFFWVTPVLAQGSHVELGPQPAGIKQLQELVQRAINLIVPLGFVAATVVLVVAGVKFIVSGGEAKSIANAWTTVTWALLGIVFLIVAWLILLLIEAFTGVKVTQFSLTFPWQ